MNFPAKEAITIVVSVSNIAEREQLMKRIYTNLTKEPDLHFSVVQDQFNRIKLFHNAENGVRVLLRTYLILIIPVLVDLGPLHSIYGTIDFHLEETIKHLQSLTANLQALQGRRIVKGSKNEQTLKQLDQCLRGTNAGNGASKAI